MTHFDSENLLKCLTHGNTTHNQDILMVPIYHCYSDVIVCQPIILTPKDEGKKSEYLN